MISKISIISGILFVGLALLVASGITKSLDSAILLWINQYASSSLDVFFVAAAHLGGVLFMTVVGLVLVSYFLMSKRKKDALFVALSLGGAALASVLLKSLFDRPRPDLWEWIVVETSHSFPSGHATATLALAVCILLIVWRTRWRVAAIVALSLYVGVVSLSRLYLGVHYPTDILGGWLLALGWVTGVYWVLYKAPRSKRGVA